MATTRVILLSFLNDSSYQIIGRSPIDPLCRGVGLALNHFPPTLIDVIRDRFTEIEFHRLVPTVSAPFIAYQDFEKLRVFLPIPFPSDPLKNDSIVLEQILSCLGVIGVNQMDRTIADQQAILAALLGDFCKQAKLPENTLPIVPFPGIFLKTIEKCFQLFVQTITEQQICAHLPLAEAENGWQSISWGDEQRRTFFRIACLKYAATLLFNSYPILMKSARQQLFDVPLLKEDEIAIAPSLLNEQLLILLKSEALNALFSRLKSFYEVDRAAILINGLDGGEFVPLPWSGRKVIVLYAGGFSNDPQENYLKIIQMFRKHFQLAIPKKLRQQNLSEENWRILYPAAMQKIEIKLLQVLRDIIAKEPELAELISATQLLAHMQPQVDNPNTEELQKKAEELREEIIRRELSAS